MITFAVSAFLMALLYRSWKLARQDQLEPDAEDLAIASRVGAQAETPQASEEDTDFRSDDPVDGGDDPDVASSGRGDGRGRARRADADASIESGAEGPTP